MRTLVPGRVYKIGTSVSLRVCAVEADTETEYDVVRVCLGLCGDPAVAAYLSNVPSVYLETFRDRYVVVLDTQGVLRVEFVGLNYVDSYAYDWTELGQT